MRHGAVEERRIYVSLGSGLLLLTGRPALVLVATALPAAVMSGLLDFDPNVVVPLVTFPAVLVAVWRTMRACLSFNPGEQTLHIRNSLRSYRVSTSEVHGATMVLSGREPPKVAFVVSSRGRRRAIAVDATTRFTEQGRREVAESISALGIVEPSTLVDYRDSDWH